MQIKSHRDLRVWQLSKALVVDVYQITQGLPPNELYGLSSQLRRAAVSIPANLAEGHGRNTRNDYAYFVGIAYGSLMELETLVEICCDLKYVQAEKSAQIFESTSEIGRMLQVLRSRLAQPASSQTSLPLAPCVPDP